MGCYDGCGSNSKSIIITALIALVLFNIINNDECREYVGDVMLAVGQLLITGATYPGCHKKGCNYPGYNY